EQAFELVGAAATYRLARCGRSVVRVSWVSCHNARKAARCGSAPSRAARTEATTLVRKECSATDSASGTPARDQPVLGYRFRSPISYRNPVMSRGSPLTAPPFGPVREIRNYRTGMHACPHADTIQMTTPPPGEARLV